MVNNKNIVVIYLDVQERVDFYLRFLNAFSSQNLHAVFITENYSLIKYIEGKNVKDSEIHYITRINGSNFFNQPDLSQALEVLLNQYSLSQAKRIYYSVWQILSHLPINRLSYFFIWNGHKIADLAMKQFAEKFKTQTSQVKIPCTP